MGNRLIARGLTVALSIAGPLGAAPPAAAAPDGSTVTGRVTSVDASGLLVSVETAGGLTELNAITVGDQVRILLPARSADGLRPSNSTRSGRLLGVWLVTMSAIVIVLRVRRRHSFLISRPVAPASL